MKKRLFSVTFVLLMLYAFTASAVAPLENYMWGVVRNGDWTTGTVFEWDATNYEYVMVGAPSVDVDEAHMMVRELLPISLAYFNYYRWDSDDSAWHDDIDLETWDCDMVYEYYRASDDHGFDNDVIGPGSCPEQSMHKAYLLHYRFSGSDIVYTRVFRGEEWDC